MALATRIIPTVLVSDNQLVKGKRFNSWRSVGNAEQAARVYAARGCDELILIDIAATPNGRGPNLEFIEKWTEDNFSPITVGGGVRSVDDVRDMLFAGADKVSICTSAIRKSNLIDEASRLFGSQAIVVSIDVTNGEVMTNCGTSCGMFGPVTYAREMEGRGAGEILLTSIDREGMMEGYDLDLIHQVSHAVSIPVIAHGGCGTPQHALEAIQAGASAIAIGAMFQFTEETPRTVAQYLSKHGAEVRL